MRKKLTIASAVSLSVLPMLMPAKDASAIPAFARKYGTSCYTCHAGFPTRNAFGEAFKANGYRWPGGEDEDKAKQEQTKMGSDGWKKSFPASPWPSDIPGYAPLAFFVTGPLVNHTDETKTKAGGVSKNSVSNWGGPFDTRLLFGGTIGEQIGFFGAIEGLAASGTNIKSRFRGTWSFAPGVMIGVGNAFSFWQSGEDEPTFNAVLPATTGTGIELSVAQGDKSGGWRLYLGTMGNGTDAATLSDPAAGKRTHLDDIRYGRFEYKIGGAGVLSGAGGTYGNEFLGLDNSLEIGASVVGYRDSLNPGATSFGYKGNHTSYAFDLTGNYGNFTGSVAWGRGLDNNLSQFGVDAGYFIYPWLLGKVAYRSNEARGSDGLNPVANITNPTYTFTLTAWPRANVSIAAAYKMFTKEWNPTTTGFADQNKVLSNPNTFTLTTALAF